MDSEATRNKWNSRYRENQENTPDAAEVLTNNVALLPKTGKALDLACGLGGNALFLAEQGLEVHAWDISPVAIDRLNTEAEKRGLTIHTAVRDVVTQPPSAESYDLIIVSRFLVRDLCPAISAALSSGGTLLYQTFLQGNTTGPSNPKFLLQANELLILFDNLMVDIYQEEEEAFLVARKINIYE